jgi:hypothetical protein
MGSEVYVSEPDYIAIGSEVYVSEPDYIAIGSKVYVSEPDYIAIGSEVCVSEDESLLSIEFSEACSVLDDWPLIDDCPLLYSDGAFDPEPEPEVKDDAAVLDNDEDGMDDEDDPAKDNPAD